MCGKTTKSHEQYHKNLFIYIICFYTHNVKQPTVWLWKSYEYVSDVAILKTVKVNIFNAAHKYPIVVI